jgi:hypothetical protein
MSARGVRAGRIRVALKNPYPPCKVALEQVRPWAWIVPDDRNMLAKTTDDKIVRFMIFPVACLLFISILLLAGTLCSLPSLHNARKQPVIRRGRALFGFFLLVAVLKSVADL